MSEPTPIEPFTHGEWEFQPAAAAGHRYRFLSPPQTSDELGRLGDYRVLRVLGTGGMGVVFEAEELALRRRVALKVLLPELAGSQDYRERFLREARAAAAIVSDHVVTIYFVSGGEVPYLAMPLLEGESLQTWIDRKPPLTLQESLEIARQTAIGLAAAHDRGLVHRDIKPANLWLEPVRTAEPATPKYTPSAKPERASGSLPSLPAAFRVKILDFGVVQVPRTESNLTASGLVMGTPNYMSPEQAAGEGLDGRSDLFGLGCVLYQMLVAAA
ncbi:MAG: serine/threonine-protein kinase [Gemmataceae bacterium]